MLAKDMHQILQIEFQNCIFFSFWGEVSDTRIFFNGQKFIMPNKGINTRKVGGIDTKIVNILLEMKNGFQ